MIADFIDVMPWWAWLGLFVFAAVVGHLMDGSHARQNNEDNGWWWG